MSETEQPEPPDSQKETIPFMFKAFTDKWRGYYPARIYDAVNPNLDIPPWEYHSEEPLEIILENGDGAKHGIVIEWKNKEKIIGSGVVSKQGERASLTYKPIYESNSFPIAGRGQYYCPFHPNTEQGTIKYWIAWETSPSDVSLTFEDQRSNGTSVVVSEVFSDLLGCYIGIYEGERFEDIDRDSRRAFEEAVNAYKSEETNQLGMSGLLHNSGHSSVKISLQPPLENGKHTLVAIAHPSGSDGEMRSPIYPPARGDGPLINWSRATVYIE